MRDDLDDQPGVPSTNVDQSCAFCQSPRPRFVHRLDPAGLGFRVHDQGWTLPGFWAVCKGCEELVVGGDDAELLRLMLRGLDDPPLLRASLAAFRAADRGAQPLRDS